MNPRTETYDQTSCPRLVPVRTRTDDHCTDCQTSPCRLNQWGQSWLIIDEPGVDTSGPFALFSAPWAWAAS